MEERRYNIGSLFGSQTSVLAVGSLVSRVSPRKEGSLEGMAGEGGKGERGDHGFLLGLKIG